MESRKSPARKSFKAALFLILGLPVLATLTIIGFGIYNQWDQITPRWRDKRAPAASSPAAPTIETNQPATGPAKN